MLISLSVSIILLIRVNGQVPFDFSAYPTTGNTAPAPVNPAFSKLYNIENVTDDGRKSIIPSKDVVKCPVMSPRTYDWLCNSCFAPITMNPPDVSSCGRKDTWALTFNDGPTASLLSFLDGQKVKATFFVLEMNVMQYPSVVQQAYKAGHLISIEGWSGYDLTSLSGDQILAELEYTRRIVKQVIGEEAAYYRPPFGDIDNHVRFVASLPAGALYTYDTGDSAGTVSLPLKLSYAKGNTTNFGLITMQTDNAITVPMAISALPLYTSNSAISFSTIAQCIGDMKPYGTGPPISGWPKWMTGLAYNTQSSVNAVSGVREAAAYGVTFGVSLAVILISFMYSP